MTALLKHLRKIRRNMWICFVLSKHTRRPLSSHDNTD